MPGSIELRRCACWSWDWRGPAWPRRSSVPNTTRLSRPRSRARKANLATLPAKLREAGVTLELGGHSEKTFLAQDLIIPSPGVAGRPDPFLQTRGRRRASRSGAKLSWPTVSSRARLIGITEVEREDDDHDARSSHSEERRHSHLPCGKRRHAAHLLREEMNSDNRYRRGA